jgi:hypothetical protein
MTETRRNNMADDPKPPDLPYLLIDARPLHPFLIDMPREWDRRGLLRRREGFDDVWHEIETNQAALGERAGITARDYQELCTVEEQLRQVQSLLPRARKLTELLEENAARLDDRIQRMIHGIAATIDIRAQSMDDRELLGPYERVRRYRSATQVQGARTRRRKRAAAAAAAAASENGSSGDRSK